MRPQTITPARQLHSMSARYRGGGARSGLPVAEEFRENWRNFHTVQVSRQKVENPHSRTFRDGKMRRLEAVLFLAREPLNSRKLSQIADLEDGTEARTLIRRLNELYDQGEQAFRIEEVAGGFQLLSRRKFSKWLRRLAHVPGESRLSSPTLETLAVIAYRQPVLRADIEAIRGVNCGEIVRQLMERDLVRISGRSEELGRPYLYSTTKRFLNMFGLVSLDDLPGANLLRYAPLSVGPPSPPKLAEEAAAEDAPAPSGEENELQYTGEEFEDG